MQVGDNPSAALLLDNNATKQKRARGQLSCTPCRAGKLKCNRLRDPACDQCIKRGRESTCQYVPRPARVKPISNVKSRIRQLESLVKDIMVKQGQGQHGIWDTDDVLDGTLDHSAKKRLTNIDANVEKPFGSLNIGRGSFTYAGEEHWQTILMSLSNIQNDLREEEEEEEDAGHIDNQDGDLDDAQAPAELLSAKSSTEEHFLLGNTPTMTKDALIAAMPDKKTSDRLLSSWFESPDPFKIVIHAPTFQDEYRRFWQSQDAPVMWLGLYYAVICLAESYSLRNSLPGDPLAADCLTRVRRYQSLTASAAVLGEYTKPKEYTIECLMLHMAGLRSDNATINAWLVMGVVVRLALRMGYHRDPSHFAKITTFQAQMRKRVWSMVSMVDVLMSFQLGLPSMVRTIASDTQPPSNLLDRDFAPLGFLPPGRSEHELTPSLYITTILRIVHIFAEAAELSHATVPPSFETTQRLNRDLEAAKAGVPRSLQMLSMDKLVADPAEQLMYRFNIDLLYLKCKIVLFRKYMLVPLAELSQQEQDKGIGACRQTCIDSARQVLEHHHTIYNAVKPGGQLENMLWYMGSIAVHDFLLAAMVLCMELSQQLQRDKMLRISGGMACPTRQAMLKALEQTHDIWSSTAEETGTILQVDRSSTLTGDSTYSETAKASKAVAAMLAKIKALEVQDFDHMTSSSSAERQFTAPQTKDVGYFERMGITPTGARTIRGRGDGIQGVLTLHQWDGIPEDYSLNDLRRVPDLSVYSSATPSAGIAIGNSTWPDAADVFADLDGDIAMNVDWQAWDNDTYNVGAQSGTDWSHQQNYLPPGSDDANVLGTQDVAASAQGLQQSTTTTTTTGRAVTADDMADFDFGGASFTPFIAHDKSHAWPPYRH